jgi:hypothetical protein
MPARPRKKFSVFHFLLFSYWADAAKKLPAEEGNSSGSSREARSGESGGEKNENEKDEERRRS